MAERRMFSIKIINSARFLKMPSEIQNLYFHLALKADDDGIVEAFTVMRIINASEDSLKLLHVKGFVHVLNDDFVTYITDWNEHNKIRSDRKIDSVYKNLLVQILPDVKLLETRPRADRQENLSKVGTSHGQPMDCIGEVRLGKDRLGKVKKDTCKSDTLHTDSKPKIKIDFEQIKELFNNTCIDLPKIKSMTDTRKKTITTWFNKDKDINLIDFFNEVQNSDFLTGRSGKWSSS